MTTPFYRIVTTENSIVSTKYEKQKATSYKDGLCESDLFSLIDSYPEITQEIDFSDRETAEKEFAKLKSSISIFKIEDKSNKTGKALFKYDFIVHELHTVEEVDDEGVETSLIEANAPFTQEEYVCEAEELLRIKNATATQALSEDACRSASLSDILEYVTYQQEAQIKHTSGVIPVPHQTTPLTIGDFVSISPEKFLRRRSSVVKPITLCKILVEIINNGYESALDLKWTVFLENNKSTYKKALNELHKRGYEFNKEYIDLKATETLYTRQSAARAIEKMLAKAEEINHNDDYIYYIDKIVLYGSYINNEAKEKVGDVDAAVFISLKKPALSVSEERQQNKDRFSAVKGESVGGIIGIFKEAAFGWEEVISVLKGRSPILSLRPVGTHWCEDDYDKAYLENIVYSDKHKTIYERTH